MTAALLVGARREARALADFPGPRPTSLAEAYAIQDAAIAAWPDRVAGWKLARIGAPHDTIHGVGRLAGPIFARRIRAAGSRPVSVAVISGGYTAIEAEYVLEIGETPPSRDRWTPEDAAGLVSRAFTGVEIAGSPYAGINQHGPAVTAADFGNNAGLVIGQAISDWRERLPGLRCAVSIDGQVRGDGGAAAIPGGPLASLAFLLNHLHPRGRVLNTGDLVSTGAAAGVHPIITGQTARADFGVDGVIDCLAIAAEPAP
ncbi:2-keto-4-pentenoate hydratase [uncultured Brevundimonas sp.]|uniref:2-keto-4-pentenoate hydratase n=1 Tax=uncultured Brevundimonas sp. TaxID=213418 RepID=UPI0030EE40F9|tara:strand:- start:15429 stop:16205 length:777 start_codon:yes stop_codon:yes gene_type:complete